MVVRQYEWRIPFFRKMEALSHTEWTQISYFTIMNRVALMTGRNIRWRCGLEG